MANEISFTAMLRASKGGATVGGSAWGKALDMSGTDMVQQPQSIATSSTAIDLGLITGAPAKLLAVNLDSTNYVELDSATSFDKFPQKLKAGDFVLLSPQTGTLYGKANTAAVNILIIAVEA